MFTKGSDILTLLRQHNALFLFTKLMVTIGTGPRNFWIFTGTVIAVEVKYRKISSSIMITNELKTAEEPPVDTLCRMLHISLFVLGAAVPQWAIASSFKRFLDHTQSVGLLWTSDQLVAETSI